MCGFIIPYVPGKYLELIFRYANTTDDTGTCNGRSIMFPGIVVRSFLMAFDVVILNRDYQQVYQ